MGQAARGGFGNTLQLGDGNLISCYSYRGVDNQTHVEVVRWSLPASNPDDQRVAVRGTVTLNGQPLAEGSIALRPVPGTRGPTAGASIKDGKYSITSQRGPFAGEFRVEILATRKTGRKVLDNLTGLRVDEYEQYLPQRYNSKSVLTVEVIAGAQNQFDFELTSR